MAEAAAPGPAASARPLGRHLLFAGLFLLAALNSVAGQAIRSVEEQGWAAASASLFGISAVVWLALVAGSKILADAPDAPPLRRSDSWAAAGVALVALLPMATASMVALTLLSLHAIFTAGAGTPLRRAGIVFLAMAGALLWGRLFLAAFSRPLLDIDAMFVAALIGAEQQGNLLWLASGGARLVVAPGCSSMQGMSLALLFWAVVNQSFSVRFGLGPALWCLAAIAATVAVNVVRIAAMLRFPEHLQAIHIGWGYHLSMWVTLALVAAICLYGARRELFGAG